MSELNLKGNVSQAGISNEEFQYAQDSIRKLSAYFDEKVVGQQNLKFSMIASIIAMTNTLLIFLKTGY